jgi:hypothetical protein
MQGDSSYVLKVVYSDERELVWISCSMDGRARCEAEGVAGGGGAEAGCGGGGVWGNGGAWSGYDRAECENGSNDACSEIL